MFNYIWEPLQNINIIGTAFAVFHEDVSKAESVKCMELVMKQPDVVSKLQYLKINMYDSYIGTL